MSKDLGRYTDPSKVFLEETSFKQEGSVVIGVMEGTRPILVEIQALVTRNQSCNAKKNSSRNRYLAG